MDMTKTFSSSILLVLKSQREEITENYFKKFENIAIEDNSKELQDLKIKRLVSDYLNEIRGLTKDINELKLLISSFD